MYYSLLKQTPSAYDGRNGIGLQNQMLGFRLMVKRLLRPPLPLKYHSAWSRPQVEKRYQRVDPIYPRNRLLRSPAAEYQGQRRTALQIGMLPKVSSILEAAMVDRTPIL